LGFLRLLLPPLVVWYVCLAAYRATVVARLPTIGMAEQANLPNEGLWYAGVLGFLLTGWLAVRCYRRKVGWPACAAALYWSYGLCLVPMWCSYALEEGQHVRSPLVGLLNTILWSIATLIVPFLLVVAFVALGQRLAKRLWAARGPRGKRVPLSRSPQPPASTLTPKSQ